MIKTETLLQQTKGSLQGGLGVKLPLNFTPNSEKSTL
jgi:hypothetical protein